MAGKLTCPTAAHPRSRLSIAFLSTFQKSKATFKYSIYYVSIKDLSLFDFILYFLNYMVHTKI